MAVRILQNILQNFNTTKYYLNTVYNNYNLVQSQSKNSLVNNSIRQDYDDVVMVVRKLF